MSDGELDAELDLPSPAEEPQAAEEPKWRPSPYLFWLIPALLMLVIVAVMPLRRSAAAMAFPYQLDREEGYVLYQAMELARGHSIYAPIDEYPFLVGNYPPVYPALYGGALHFVPPSLEAGRAIVLLAVMLILATLTNLVMRETGRLAAAVAAVALFLATYDVNNWIAFARVDFPAIALGLLGLMAVTSPMRRTGFVLGIILFVAAFHTKQTQLIAPAAALAGMLWRREWTRAGLFCALAAGLGIATFAVINIATDGGFFRHTVLYNMNVMDLGILPVWIRHLFFWGKWKYLAVAAALVFLFVTRREREAEGTRLFPECIAYFVLSGLSIYSIAKAGSAPNYLLEFHVASALLLGMTLGAAGNLWCRGVATPSRAARVAAVVMAALLTVHAFELAVGLPINITSGGESQWVLQAKRRYFDRAPSPELVEAGGRVELELADERGEILAEEAIFAIRTNHEVLYQPFIMAQLAREGRWNPAPFIADLESGRFKVIVANQELLAAKETAGFTPEMLDAIRARYELYRQIGGYYLYIPRGSRKQPALSPIA